MKDNNMQECAYCPTNECLCPFWDKGMCHIMDPYENCDDYHDFFEDWFEYDDRFECDDD